MCAAGARSFSTQIPRGHRGQGISPAQSDHEYGGGRRTYSQNPCRIRGGGQEKSPERPVLTIAQVYALAEAVDQRYRVLVLLGTFGSLRWGELAALRRANVDLDAGTVKVEQSLTELPGGGYHYGPPKSDAGQRLVSLPDLLVPDLHWHLACFVKPEDDALVFTSPTGSPLRHGNFRRRDWLAALKSAGLTGIHFMIYVIPETRSRLVLARTCAS